MKDKLVGAMASAYIIGSNKTLIIIEQEKESEKWRFQIELDNPPKGTSKVVAASDFIYGTEKSAHDQADVIIYTSHEFYKFYSQEGDVDGNLGIK